MSLIYRLLGMTAAVCTRFSRVRLNFGVPSHAAILVFMAVALWVIASDYLEVRTKDFGKPPTAYSSVAVALTKMHNGRYISITGRIAPEIRIQSTQDNSITYGVLYDPGTYRGILVEGCPAQGGPATLKGMVNCVPVGFPGSQ
ncbi:MAG: hypothetical protein ACLQVD_11950 [Capsulimonadaceae bacterium]